MSKDTESVLTVKEVSERLGITTRTVTRMIYDGRLPGAYRLTPVKHSPFRVPETAVRQIEEDRTKID